MATSRSAWKRAETSVAKLFGALRRPLSGSSNRPDIDGDDAIHEYLWIEAKLRASHTAWTLWRKTSEAARKVGKVPVVSLKEKFKQGELLVVHSADLPEVVVSWLAARADDELLSIEAAVRTRRLERAGTGPEVE